ncbi:MAG: TIGR04282 family arsenosugar biosynthesis glycosyltransferase [Pseudomonadota bacterium]
MTVIQVFARTPVLGGVKTRLAAALGDAAALAVYERLLDHTLTVARNTGLQVELWVAGDPHHDGIRRRARAFGCRVYEQVGEDLGERMHHALKAASRGGGGALLIGSDCVDLTVDRLRTAQQLLSTSDVVLGPSLDGGYYLIGTTRPDPGWFQRVAWSTTGTREQTVANAEAGGASVGLLPEGRDIDTLEDLREAERLGLYGQDFGRDRD